jgi:hypothetical protein
MHTKTLRLKSSVWGSVELNLVPDVEHGKACGGYGA